VAVHVVRDGPADALAEEEADAISQIDNAVTISVLLTRCRGRLEGGRPPPMGFHRGDVEPLFGLGQLSRSVGTEGPATMLVRVN
jgi:hypothetical protein